MITSEQKSNMVSDYARGGSMQQVADKHGVSWGTVRNALVAAKASIRKVRKYHMNEAFFERIDSHEKAQILGFYWADGCLHLRADGQASFLALALNPKDKGYLEWVNQQMNSDYPIREYHHTRDYVRLSITHHKPLHDIQRLGIFPRKSLVIGFPTAEQVSTEFLNSFVLGVFEGDGCIHLKKGGGGAGAVAQFAATINFNQSLQQALVERGIESKIEHPAYAKGKNFCKLNITKLDSIFKLWEWMYAGSSYRMERKWILFQELRDRYDKDGVFIETEEWKAARKERLGKVRKSWKATNITKTKMSATRRRILKKSYVSFCAKSPDGTIYQANTISDFAREMGLNVACFHNFVRQRGSYRSYKKWTIPTESEISAARATNTLITKSYRI